MLYIVWFLSLIASFMLGYYFRDTRQKVKALEELVKEKVDKPKQPEEPQSMLIDPDDPIQTAQWEQAEMMRKLNNIQPDE